MIAPASDTAIRSATLTGNIENATAALPDVTSCSSSAGAAGAADEIDSLVGADVRDFQDRREQPVLQHADVERRDRIRRDRAPCAAAACATRRSKYIAMSPRLRRRRRARRDIEALADRGEKRSG